ncbi:hypothetical protein AKO1_001524 [Acrasis kona]|uniref:Uncharacterized protein n=1 Tax=Acrasis kona TaxID=1008807 RepID=A0AAW2ZB87_9EUKA
MIGNPALANRDRIRSVEAVNIDQNSEHQRDARVTNVGPHEIGPAVQAPRPRDNLQTSTMHVVREENRLSGRRISRRAQYLVEVEVEDEVGQPPLLEHQNQPPQQPLMHINAHQFQRILDLIQESNDIIRGNQRLMERNQAQVERNQDQVEDNQDLLKRILDYYYN